MEKVERYFYPAVFTCEPGQEIAVCFPDLGCATSGIDDQDALLSARELLGCVMIGLEEDGEELPSPTPLPENRASIFLRYCRTPSNSCSTSSRQGAPRLCSSAGAVRPRFPCPVF